MCKQGSPPHMRGKVVVMVFPFLKVGITPAHAGKSRMKMSLINLTQDHPRTCGEKKKHSVLKMERKGSPPHMRGKVCNFQWKIISCRITPAHAGKSTSFPFYRRCGQDHPRTCGEKSSSCILFSQSCGSPPHMRGKVS